VLPRLLLFAAPLLGHDLYLMPERFRMQPGETVQVAIHNGDRFPESEQPPVLARVRDFGISGGPAAAGLRIDGARAVGTLRPVTPGTVVVAARTVANFLSLPPAKFAAYLKEEGLDWVIAERERPGNPAGRAGNCTPSTPRRCWWWGRPAQAGGRLRGWIWSSCRSRIRRAPLSVTFCFGKDSRRRACVWNWPAPGTGKPASGFWGARMAAGASP
jgi:hypothetical protein